MGITELAAAWKGEAMPRQPNARLAEVMRRAHCSNTSLAARVQAVAREHGADLKCTRVDVRRWLDGVMHQVHGHQPATSSSRRLVAGRVVAVTAVALSEPDPPVGEIERILFDLGVTGELLNRGMALDRAAPQLIAEAADRTAPQRWHRAVTRPGVTINASAIIRRVLATEQPEWTARLQSMLAPADRNLESQPEPLQAEP